MAGAVWLSELSAVLRGKKRQAMAPMVSNDEHQQHQMRKAAVHGNKAAAADGKPRLDRKDTVAGSGGMSDATVYMLFDRFAPRRPASPPPACCSCTYMYHRTKKVEKHGGLSCHHQFLHVQMPYDRYRRGIILY
jgi:hypothetical protein